jgi:predicted membrane-bound mannosyltransferase
VLVAVLTVQALGERATRHIRIACSIGAALFFLNCGPVMVWAPLMRVDMLAGALGLAGLVLAIRAIDRPVMIHAAAVTFVLSIYTKQVSIAAPMAAFGVLLLVN